MMFRSPAGQAVSDPVVWYFTRVGRHELLTGEQEKNLARRFRNHGDKDAANRLVAANLRLVVKIAMDLRRAFSRNGKSMNLLDLIQEGNTGLTRAVQKFDPEKNIRFSYYSSFWIKAFIMKFIMDNWSLIKIGTTVEQRKLFFRLKKEKTKLQDQGIRPTPERLSRHMGISAETIETMGHRLEYSDASLNAPLTSSSDVEWLETTMCQEESVEDLVSKKQAGYLLNRKIIEFRRMLNPREAVILDRRLRPEKPATLREIGERFGVSRQRVNQMEKRVLEKLRTFLESEFHDLRSWN